MFSVEVNRFTNGLDLTQFVRELSDSNITSSLLMIKSSEQREYNIMMFNSELSTSDISKLDTLIDNHVPKPLNLRVFEVDAIKPENEDKVSMMSDLDMNGFRIIGSNFSSTQIENELDSHTTDLNNPHAVTLEQVRALDNKISGDIDLNSNSLLNVSSIKIIDTDDDSKSGLLYKRSSEDELYWKTGRGLELSTTSINISHYDHSEESFSTIGSLSIVVWETLVPNLPLGAYKIEWYYEMGTSKSATCTIISNTPTYTVLGRSSVYSALDSKSSVSGFKIMEGYSGGDKIEVVVNGISSNSVLDIDNVRIILTKIC